MSTSSPQLVLLVDIWMSGQLFRYLCPDEANLLHETRDCLHGALLHVALFQGVASVSNNVELRELEACSAPPVAMLTCACCNLHPRPVDLKMSSREGLGAMLRGAKLHCLH